MNRWMRLVGAWTLACAAAAADAADSPAAVPIKAFFAEPRMARPVLSPDGQYLAVHVGNEKTGRRDLMVIELGPSPKATIVARFADSDIDEVHWVNRRRLVFTLKNTPQSWDVAPCPGLWASNHDGTERRRLIRNDCIIRQEDTRPSLTQARELLPNHSFVRVLRDGSDDVMIERRNLSDDDRRETIGLKQLSVLDTSLLRLNTVTAQVRAVAVPGYPAGPQRWLVDQNGAARLVYTTGGGQTDLHWRAGDDAAWQKIPGVEPQGFEPVTIGPDGELYAVATRDDAARTRALFRFDRQALKLSPEPIVGIAGFDFLGEPIFDHRQRKLIGVRYTGDATSTVWLDESMKQLQARVDKLVPDRVNLLHVAECGCSRWVVVQSYSDRQPDLFLIYDRESDRVNPIGSALPEIDPRRMAERDFVRFDARDGLSIPLHVTKPAGKGPWPMVVLVHGGPWVRGGSWQWTAESQFLASRGYLVIEPEYRGSRGYGSRHWQAGWKQLGLKMQDDLADAARWAINAKLADPQRVCIAGAGYGGYAALMGLARDPQLYRCGVAWAAVTDLELMFEQRWRSEMPDDWRLYGMSTLVGDRSQDAWQLAATSPMKQADRIRRPLLLAFGGDDKRVPIEHGSKFRDAVKKVNDLVEWIEYANEGHGFSKPENRYDFYGRMEKFLDTHLQAK
jgi:dipeptidyl aminopeptidase/acylaminoacyl peptidase